MTPRSRLLVPFVILLIAPSFALAATWNVHPDGTGDTPTIQAAIDSAANGDEVVLSNGEFRGEGNEEIDFLGKAIIVRSASGDPDLCVIDLDREQWWEPRRGFLFQNGEGSGSVLRGVTIRKGYVGAGEPVASGAGVYCPNSSPTIENCLFDSCSAGEDGGGLYVSGNAGVVVTGCVFVRCWAGRNGGGACVRSGAHAVIEACLFEENRSGSRGGGIEIDYGSAVVTRSIFRGNSGGMTGGGGIFVEVGDLQVDDSRFEGNYAGNGGGLFQIDGGTLVILGSLFQGNQALWGGGIIADGPEFCILDRCTVAGNLAYHRGGGLLYTDGTAQITNSILWGNCADGGGRHPDDLHLYEEFEPSYAVLLCTDIDTLGIAGSGEALLKAHNIHTDPLFCDPVDCGESPTTEGDYTLHADSPCLDQPYCVTTLGALGEGCGVTTSVRAGRSEPTNWGAVKKLWR